MVMFPSHHNPSVSYAALAAFYAKDQRRRTSREVDLGLWWRGETGLPSYRAAWVEDTGEVYLVKHGPARGAGEVTVLAHEPDRRALERRLRGWRDVCGESGSIQWLRGRLSGQLRDGRGERLRVA